MLKNGVKTFLVNYFLPLGLLFFTLSFIGYLSTFALLKVELDSAVDSDLKIFWSDENTPFSEQQAKFTQTQTGKQNYWFLINDFRKQTYFRIDPASQKTKLAIYSIKLYSFHYLPIEFNLFNDVMAFNEIKLLDQQTASDQFIEFMSMGDDPQIEIRPIHVRTSFVTLGFLILIAGILFGKKQFFLIFSLLAGLLFLYYLLNFNESRVSFHAQADKAGQIKVFWRDKNERYSNTRARQVAIKPGTHYYSVKTGNISNIEVLYIEKSAEQSVDINEIKIKEPGFKTFSLAATESIIEKLGETKKLLISVATFLIIYCLFLWRLYTASYNNERMGCSPFFHQLTRLSFLLSSFLVINLAWQSKANIHPDEIAHIESTKYYSENWNPPTVGDSRAIAAYQEPWAISRLDDLGISYFFAGKFRSIVEKVYSSDTFTARAFNVLLFILFFVLSRNKRLSIFLVPLLCSPQFWYLYAYANRGGFVLFISILLAWELVNEKSSLNTFLTGNKPFTHWKSSLYPGLLLGILSIEQTNYLLFILFVFSVLFWRLLFFVENKKTFIYKCFIFMAIGSALFSVRYGFDVSINGLNKQEQRIAYAEQHAGKQFKPSIAETKESYSGLRLKAKGVGFAELFQPEWDWHKMTFKSFVGFYGYYAEYSPKWYYSYILIIYAIILLALFKHAFFRENWRYNLFSFISLTAISGGILMGLLFSWLHDFQPQGRYVFPIIPIILVYFWTIFPRLKHLEKSILLASVIVLTLLSFYSFNEVALNYLVS